MDLTVYDSPSTHGVCLYCMAVLSHSVNPDRLSKCGELNWCECLYKGRDDSRGGNANDLYGQ